MPYGTLVVRLAFAMSTRFTGSSHTFATGNGGHADPVAHHGSPVPLSRGLFVGLSPSHPCSDQVNIDYIDYRLFLFLTPSLLVLWESLLQKIAPTQILVSRFAMERTQA